MPARSRSFKTRRANRDRCVAIEPLERRKFLDVTTPTATPYHLSFDDEFNSLNLAPYSSSGYPPNFNAQGNPTTFGWLSRDQGDNTFYTGTKEAQYYANPSQGDAYNPYSVSNDGVLTITARATPASMVQTTGAEGSVVGKTYQPYVSGELTSAVGGQPYNFSKGFSQKYGYFEIRAQAPSSPGSWPAFWMLPEPNLNISHTSAEYDVFEIPVDGDPKLSPYENTSTIYQTAHGSTGVEQIYHAPFDASAGMHTYGFEWDANSVRWYVDGVLTNTQANDCNTPMYLLANLAIGGTGSWPGAPTASSMFPEGFKIDYIRGYSNDPTVATATAQSGYSISDTTIAGTTPEPAMAGAVVLGLIYLTGRRPGDRGNKPSPFSLG